MNKEVACFYYHGCLVGFAEQIILASITNPHFNTSFYSVFCIFLLLIFWVSSFSNLDSVLQINAIWSFTKQLILH